MYKKSNYNLLCRSLCSPVSLHTFYILGQAVLNLKKNNFTIFTEITTEVVLLTFGAKLFKTLLLICCMVKYGRAGN